MELIYTYPQVASEKVFPNIILEASYTGLPIIATDVGDTKKIIYKKG